MPLAIQSPPAIVQRAEAHVPNSASTSVFNGLARQEAGPNLSDSYFSRTQQPATQEITPAVSKSPVSKDSRVEPSHSLSLGQRITDTYNFYCGSNGVLRDLYEVVTSRTSVAGGVVAAGATIYGMGIGALPLAVGAAVGVATYAGMTVASNWTRDLIWGAS